MHIFWWIAGLALAAVWLDRMQDAVRGMKHVADISRPEWDRQPQPQGKAPRVSIVVPARNEEENVVTTLESFAAQDYADYEILALDDRSTDSTGRMIEDVAVRTRSSKPGLRFEVIHIRELPPGWLGKTHAMWLAAQRATGDWLLFTDADVRPRSDALRRAIAYAEQVRADHLVLFPTHALKTAGESMVLAGFQMLFVFGHRPWKVSDPKTKDCMGLGPFNLLRRSTYESIGTFHELRLEVVEDMKLGELVKAGGFSQHNVFGPGLLNWRWGRGGSGIMRNLTKNLFAVLMYNSKRALAACFLLLLLNILPFAGVWLAPGWSKIGFALAVAAIGVLYLGMYRGSGIHPAYFLLHPLNSGLIAYTLLRSMAATLWRGAVVWRGTKYDLGELKGTQPTARGPSAARD